VGVAACSFVRARDAVLGTQSRTPTFDTVRRPALDSATGPNFRRAQTGADAWSSFLYLIASAPAAGRRRRPTGGARTVNNKPTYLSKDGLEKLRAELEEMVTKKRPEVAQRIHDAKEHGDLSENAEYEDAKNEQAFVEGRIQTLEALIKNATIIDENHSTDHVQIGSTVKVESDDGTESFTIVGSAEAKPAEGRISNESPVGRALLGKKKGEKVVVRVPAGDFTYKVVSIS
jgi:transcription elongation factor GreA